MTMGSASGSERRAAPRRRTLLRGRICYGDHYVISVDCGIRDLSESGAQIRVSASQPLPGRFVLIHILDGLAFDANLAWRRGEFAGVKFNARHNLKGDIEGELRSIKAIWTALAPA